MIYKFFLILFIALIFSSFIPVASAAHFIVGRVNDAMDGTIANDRSIVLWNPSFGEDDNVTGIIGPNGNSETDNIYLVDCEELNNGCFVGNKLSIKVLDEGDRYITSEVNVTVSGTGFDVAPNLTLNSPPVFNLILLDDGLINPAGEIDLTPATTTQVTCEGVIFDYDGEDDITSSSARVFDAGFSYSDPDDNNNHYSNSSCFLDAGFGGPLESYATCSFDLEYYADSNIWNCTMLVNDHLNISNQGSNISMVNPLLAIQLEDTVDFGQVNALEVSEESIINVTNMGNVEINLSLSGYAVTPGDNLAMNCTEGLTKNIPINYQRYNLTASNPGFMDLQMFESSYRNLSSISTIRSFNLGHRSNDLAAFLDDTGKTYWRIYVPSGVAGSCEGNIIFGAAIGPEN